MEQSDCVGIKHVSVNFEVKLARDLQHLSIGNPLDLLANRLVVKQQGMVDFSRRSREKYHGTTCQHFRDH